MSLVYLLLIIIAIEVGLFISVSILSRNFPWIITKKDELPILESEALKKFIEYSFDSKLGWVRRPNTNGIENGQKGKIEFNIDSIGSRSNSLSHLPSHIAAFGDSYAFCRQVENDETWEAQLSKNENFGVLNFGVGNYGVDQALLRYERTNLPDSVKIVVMGFVPETICRIQSHWKHYLEFGNTFAFKPRFVFDSTGDLSLIDNPMRALEDFEDYHSKLPKIQKVDRFYLKKFRSLQFRFPYTLSLMRNPLKQGLLILSVIISGILKKLKISNAWVENLPFMFVMKNNIRDSHELYEDDESIKLLNAILVKFQKLAVSRGHIPLVLVLPQLLDIKLSKKNKAPYQKIFNDLSDQVSLLDLTDEFKKYDFEKLYINDQYGGHLSAKGNHLVAENISTWLTENIS